MNLLEILTYITENKNTAFFYTPPIYSNPISYLLINSISEVKIFPQEEIDTQLNKIDDLLQNNFTAFGYIEYEFGYLLEEKLQKYQSTINKPLLHFLFAEENSVRKINSREISFTDVEKYIGEETIADFTLNTTKEEYIENVEKIKEYIKNGDTYQVNYTVKSKFRLTSNVISLFLQLIFAQSAKYSAIINLGNKFIISSSPELFYEIEDNYILVKPMKGTIKRGVNIKQDLQMQKELLASEKDRAENIMIVDLLRNDIGKVCDYNSVKAEKNFFLEKYESVFQLTSEVRGKLITNKFSDLIKNIFPSGSITGAPKLRTMEIINELEQENRGIYTGTIGMLNKHRSITNVAIRSIEIDLEKKTGELGIGSGVVWDSLPINEFDEVLLKSKFLTEPVEYFELLETMLFEKGNYFLLNYHLERLKSAADYFLFLFDTSKIENELFNATKSLDIEKSYKIRLTLSKWGSVKIETEEIIKITDSVDVIISNKKIDTKNKFQYFKTTNRKLYDDELNNVKELGFFETIYFNENNYLAEGSFTNILFENKNKYITPQIEDGILNGCFRQFILDLANNNVSIESGISTNVKNELGILKDSLKIEEKSITFDELINSERIILINSVRKILYVRNLFDSKGKLIKKFD